MASEAYFTQINNQIISIIFHFSLRSAAKSNFANNNNNNNIMCFGS